MFCTPYINRCRIAFLISLHLLFIQCKRKSHEATVAAYGDSQLYWSEVAEVVPDNISEEDSLAFADKYIKDWLVRQIIIEAAENGLSEDQLNVDKMVSDYANSLKIHAFEEEWVRQKLDTNVTEAEIRNYYEANASNFELKQFLVKIKFTSVATDYRQLSTLKKLFFSDRPEDLVKWQQACVAAGAASFMSEEEWMTWDDFLKQVPVEIYDIAAFLKRQKKLEFEKDGLLYLIRFMEVKLSGSASPLEFEKTRIVNLILNRRKRQLLDQMRLDLYAKAEAEQKITKFNP
jgi:hypothetical protein